MELEFDTRNLIIGNGQIGQALYKIFNRKSTVFIRDVDGPVYDKIDNLHIAFPYSDDFITQVTTYIEMYSPTLVIVYSTVPIGTCEKIDDSIVHSPIEGRHPDLEDSIKMGVRWLGCSNEVSLAQAIHFWTPFVATVRTVPSAAYTELLKIRSTAKFGVNLVWTDYEKNLADLVGMDFSVIKRFDRDYNDLYAYLGYHDFKRYILDPPNGAIGGHCVVPNAELLDKQYPHPMLKAIKKMRPKR